MNTTLNYSTEADVKPLLKIALPLILTSVVQSSLYFMETVFIAKLGTAELAAGSLVSWLFAVFIVILFGTFNAINILIAHKYGEKDFSSISLILRDSLILALMLWIPTFLIIWNIAPFFELLGQKASLVPLATAYLHGLAWGLLPKFIMIVLFEFFIGLGHTRVLMATTLIFTPLYIFLSYALIFGYFGFPRLDIAGAGWAMTIGDFVTTFCLCIFVLTNKKYSSYFFALFTKKSPCYLWEILHIGLPMGLMYCIEVGFFFAVTLLMGLISIQAIAANQISMQYVGFFTSVVFCISQAITVRMSHSIGAKELPTAERASNVGIAMAVIFMLIIAVIYWLIPHLLIAIDLNLNDAANSEIIIITTTFFHLAAFFQIFESARIALMGSLRALKETRYILFTSVVSFWCVALPIGYIFAAWLKLEGNGYWIAMCLGAIINIALLQYQYKHKIRELR